MQRLVLSLVLGASPLLPLSQPSDAYDLSIQYAQGQNMTGSLELEMEMNLDDVSVDMGGMDPLAGGGVLADMSVEATDRTSIEVLEVEDGEIRKARISTLESEYSVSGSYDAMGESDSFDESEEGDLVGFTLEVTYDEDGEATDVKVIEGDEDDLPEDAMEQVGRNPFSVLLPDDEVSVGASWSLEGEAWEEFVAEMQSEMDEDPEAAQAMEAMSEYLTTKATGKLVSVEDGIAELEWMVEWAVEIDDLLGLAADVSGEDLSQMAPGAEASLDILVELRGTGRFDLEQHQLTEARFEAEMSMDTEASASGDGIEAEASASASGDMSISWKLSFDE